jgi:peroxiredoxin family protein
MSSMIISLASGSLEKLVVASTLAGGAVALEMDVDLYLLLGGAYAFRKDVGGAAGTYADRPELKDEMLAGMAGSGVPDPIENLRNLKTMGNVRIHCCQAAGKIWGAGDLEDFVDVVDDIVGIAKYITDCKKADVVQLL